jgi:CRP-like cAMP-binding protein
MAVMGANHDRTPTSRAGGPPDYPGPGTGNRLIDCLPKVQAERLASVGDWVELVPSAVLYREGGPISHVYFPASGCCGYVIALHGRRQIETTTVGNEGMLGIHLALGLNFSPLMAVCLVPGIALRIPVRTFMQTIRGFKPLESLARRYAAYCLRYASQNIACNTLHTARQRVCRRLLMAQDRAGKDEFALTQEVLGQMLGVHRQAITLVATALQAANFIEYRRGTIRILNRNGLESASCECYRITKTAYDSIVMRSRDPAAETEG